MWVCICCDTHSTPNSYFQAWESKDKGNEPVVTEIDNTEMDDILIWGIVF